MKKSFFLISLTCVVCVLAAAVFVAPRFINWAHYAPLVQEKVAAQTGYRLDLGEDFGAAFLPAPRFYARDLKLSLPAYGDTPLLEVGQLDVHVALWPLLRGALVLRAVDLERPVLLLKTDADGRLLWKAERPDQGQGQDQLSRGLGVVETNTKREKETRISLNQMRVRNGRVRYRDQVLEALQMDIRAESLRGPFVLEGSFDVKGQGVSFRAKTGDFSTKNSALPLNLEADLMPLGLRLHYAGVAAPDGAQGEIEMSVLSSLKMAGRDFKGATLKALMSATGARLTLDSLHVNHGADNLAGRVSTVFAARETNMVLSGKLGALGATKIIGDVAWGDVITLKNAEATFGQALWRLNGSYHPRKGERQPRGLLTLEARGNALEFASLEGSAEGRDTLQAEDQVRVIGEKEAVASSALAHAVAKLQGLKLPMDVAADIGVQKLRFAEHEAKSLNLKFKFD